MFILGLVSFTWILEILYLIITVLKKHSRIIFYIVYKIILTLFFIKNTKEYILLLLIKNSMI